VSGGAAFGALVVAALLTGVALSLVMAGAFLVQRWTGNSGWIDATWSFGVGGVGVAAALWPVGPDWPHWRQLLVAMLAAAWCLRLGLHIAGRAGATSDDPRYRKLIQEWGADAPRRLFWFLQSQAAVGIILVLAIFLAAHDPAPGLRVQDVLGALLLLAAVTLEGLADGQLRAFNRDPANRGRVCDVGLWAWSRHPNYFFEWLVWVAFAVLAIDLVGGNPFGWLALAAPVCMYWVLVHVSGIPPLEQHMLRTRGETFRAYQRRTPAFFPAPPRS
jgi:steroid 5-alpha reductase family enzyme